MKAVRESFLVLSVVLFAGLPDAATALNVTFTDTNLDMAVSAVLGKPITSSNMLALTNLIACRRYITNLDGTIQGSTNRGGLASATNLKSLDISGNSVSDLSPLAGLANLTDLNAGGNLILDVSPLTGLTNLTNLWLYGNTITNLSWITNLNRLHSLFLFNCGLADVTPLRMLTNLNCLDLRWNSISNDALVSVCTNLTNLTSLHLGGYPDTCPVTNLTFLRPLTRLTLLDVGYAGISNSSALDVLTNLKSLNYVVLRGNPGITNYSVLSGLTGLANLELRQNSISKLTFLSSLSRLSFADLACNSITNLSPLANLTNLSAVNLSGNPNTNYVPALSGISSLWLFQNSISNVTFLTNMIQLTGLGLDDNLVNDPALLAKLPNLHYLGLSRNPLTNYGVLAGFTNLTSLWLDGNESNYCSDLSFVQGLGSLRNLSVRNNRLRNLTNLTSMAGLDTVYSGYNRLTNISVLTNLPHLSRVELFENLHVDLAAVDTLNKFGVEVDYVPTNQPPILSTPPAWYIPANQTSSLSFYVSDALVSPDELTMTANSSNQGLVTNSNVVFRGTNFSRSITVTPTTNQTGTTIITLTASQPPGGLSINSNILMTVMFPTNVVLEPNLSNIVYTALVNSGRNLTTNLTSVDLMYLTSLNAYSANISDLSGLQWASNLTALYLGGNGISNLAPLQNLSGLTSLELDNNLIADVSPLAGLTGLTYLDLSWNPITNCVALSGLSNLTTLNLTGDSITNLSFLTNLTQLVALYLGGNLLTNIAVLQTLPALSYVDLTYNLLDVSPLSPAMAVITNLLGRGVNVVYLPQILDGQFLNSTSLVWQTGGDAAWFGPGIFGHVGYPTAQSGAITNNQVSWLQTTVVGPGTLTFWWKVSSESNYDWLGFWVADDTNGISYTNGISGEVDWQQQIVNVSSGPQTLNWQYSKDPTISIGWDAAWLAQVTFVPGIWLEIIGPVTNNQCSLLLHAVPGNLYEILVSTNLANWSSLAPIVPTNTAMPFLDTNAFTATRFYRLHSLSLSSIWLESQGLTNGSFQLLLHSSPGLPLAVQASTSFTNWTTLTTLTNTLGTVAFTDTQSAGFLFRFYRAMLLNY